MDLAADGSFRKGVRRKDPEPRHQQVFGSRDRDDESMADAMGAMDASPVVVQNKDLGGAQLDDLVVPTDLEHQLLRVVERLHRILVSSARP